MKKTFLILAFLVSITPLFVSADSYDGPYCYESVDGGVYSQSEDEKHIRGTCKFLDSVNSSVSLEKSLQNDYLLATHKGIDSTCDNEYKGIMSCNTTKKSEILNLDKKENLFFVNVFIGRPDDYQKESVVGGDSVLLDKKYTLNYITDIYKKEGRVC